MHIIFFLYSFILNVYHSTFIIILFLLSFFFFQAEDGIRDAQESRGLGDVYKRQVGHCATKEEVGDIHRRMQDLEGQVSMRGSKAVEERNSADIAQIKQELSSKADGVLMTEARRTIAKTVADLAELQQSCDQMERDLSLIHI
eukprot:TRINITY_DN30085_c0_g1_i2.p1 TRINITY_DN30085_c0_g1~~TRINITY_DN30085_c0_g1_i2.p1  ORF type:complete len:143 (+),score=48.21 TRINITY_DN30085_c0_g1_i2:27-455(+)